MIRIVTKQELVVNVNNTERSFKIGYDIAFDYDNKELGYVEHIICRIIGWSEHPYHKNDGYIIGDKLEVKDKNNYTIKHNEDVIRVFKFENMSNFHSVDNGWA